MLKNILIVDDEVSFAKTLAYAFEKEGYHAVAKSTAEEALAYCKDVRPNLILSDLVMGKGMDGLDLLEKLNDIPFVLLTASGDREIFNRAKNLGAKACLWKPVDLDALLKVVRDLVPKT